MPLPLNGLNFCRNDPVFEFDGDFDGVLVSFFSTGFTSVVGVGLLFGGVGAF